VLDNGYSLAPDAWTVYQQLRLYGYRTSLFGKLDLHKPQGYNGVNGDLPICYQLGFTDPCEAEGKQHGAHVMTIEAEDGSRQRLLLGPYQQHLHAKGLLDVFCADYDLRDDACSHYAEPSALPCEDFEDTWIGQRACQWLENVTDDAPWFTFVSFVGPHNPWDAPKEYLDRYLDVDMPAPMADPGTARPEWMQNRQEEMGRGTDDATALKMRQNYAGMITLIDDAIGDMLAVLERRGMLDNTLVIYTSDHGEMLGDLGIVQKSVQYEPALRVPMIISGKDVPALGVSDALVELFDLTPTVLDWVGVPVPPRLDARSLAPILRGETTTHRDVQVGQLPFTSCVRDERFKLILNPNDISELYDIEVDPHELSNVIDQHPDVVRRLSQRLQEELTGGMELNG